MNPRRKLTNDEAAQYLGISPKTLPKWRCQKRPHIAFYKVGHGVQYDEADLVKFLESRKVRVDAGEGR